MLFHSMIPLLGFAPAAALATHLFVSSYDGSITSLQLSKSVRGSYSLTNLSSTLGSAPRPSWLEINPFNGLLYAVDEGWGNPNGSVAAYSRSAGGVLTQVSILPTIGSPVSTQVFNKGAALAMAHLYVPVSNCSMRDIANKYSDTSTVSNFKIKADGSLALLQTFTFALAAPGPVPDRQGVPHEHQVILDPTVSSPSTQSPTCWQPALLSPSQLAPGLAMLSSSSREDQPTCSSSPSSPTALRATRLPMVHAA